VAKVYVSATLRRLTGRRAEFDVPAATLGQVIDGLEAACPGFRDGVVRGDRMRPGVSALIDGVGSEGDLTREVGPDSEVDFFLVPSGG